VFSCGWHITLDGHDVYTWKLKALVNVAGRLARLARFADLDDQVEATRRVFASDTRWTVVRGSDLEEGASQGLPVWSSHVGDPILRSDITRRVDFALFMLHALEDDGLVHEAPAIVSSQSASALAHVRRNGRGGVAGRLWIAGMLAPRPDLALGRRYAPTGRSLAALSHRLRAGARTAHGSLAAAP
jgi:hypothetical protein